MAYTPVPYLFGLLRKNLFDSSLSSNSNASVAHHAEPHHHHPQLKAKSAAPVNITAAPLRRQSEVSQFSSATSNDGLTDGGGLEGHVPHLICKFSSFFKILLTVQLASCPHALSPYLLPPCLSAPTHLRLTGRRTCEPHVLSHVRQALELFNLFTPQPSTPLPPT